MAVQLMNEHLNRKWQGLKADTKPTDAGQGDEFFEQDTSITYVYNGNSWIIKSDRSFGDYGGTYYNDTSAHTGDFCAIQVIESCEITTLGNLALTSVEISSGTIIYGNFTSLTLASGAVIAYNGGV